MGLQVEVPVARLGNAAVNNCAGMRVLRSVSLAFVGWGETCTAPLADDDDCHAREAILSIAGCAHGFAGFLQEWKLTVDRGILLAFGDAVAVEHDVHWHPAFVLCPDSDA